MAPCWALAGVRFGGGRAAAEVARCRVAQELQQRRPRRDFRVETGRESAVAVPLQLVGAGGAARVPAGCGSARSAAVVAVGAFRTAAGTAARLEGDAQ